MLLLLLLLEIDEAGSNWNIIFNRCALSLSLSLFLCLSIRFDSFEKVDCERDRECDAKKEERGCAVEERKKRERENEKKRRCVHRRGRCAPADRFSGGIGYFKYKRRALAERNGKPLPRFLERSYETESDRESFSPIRILSVFDA